MRLALAVSGTALLCRLIKRNFSNKKSRSQLIISGVIAVLIAAMIMVLELPVTFAEVSSPDGKYKLVAQYPLREGIICSLSMAGGGDEEGTLILKSSDGREINKTGLIMQEFQVEAVKWHSEYVEMNQKKWFYDGKVGEVLNPESFFRNVSLAEASQGIADVAENKTINQFTANVIQNKSEFETFKNIFELLTELQTMIDKGITPPMALFAAPPDKKQIEKLNIPVNDYRQLINELWILRADDYRIFADFMEKNHSCRLLFHEYLGKFFYEPNRKTNYSCHIATAYLRRRITIPPPQEHRERIARQITDSFACQYAAHYPQVLTGLSDSEQTQLQEALAKNNDFMENDLAVLVNYFQKFPAEKDLKKLLKHYYPQKQYPPDNADGYYLYENYSLGFKLIVYHILLTKPELRDLPENRVWCQSLYTGFGYYPEAKNWKK